MENDIHACNMTTVTKIVFAQPTEIASTEKGEELLCGETSNVPIDCEMAHEEESSPLAEFADDVFESGNDLDAPIPFAWFRKHEHPTPPSENFCVYHESPADGMDRDIYMLDAGVDLPDTDNWDDEWRQQYYGTPIPQ
jgi:hypothetical protein